MGEPLPSGDYYALVSRAERRPLSEVLAWSVRSALPVITIPLAHADSDIALNLAEIVARTFCYSRYERSIDYSRPLNLPLAPDDRAWAEALARTAVA